MFLRPREIFSPQPFIKAPDSRRTGIGAKSRPSAISVSPNEKRIQCRLNLFKPSIEQFLERSRGAPIAK
jgi:hypothetical protein